MRARRRQRHRFPEGPSRRTSVSRPVTAAAAAIAGLMRWVRAPGPCRPSKFRLEVDATRSPGRAASPFIATHIEHPGSRHSKPASRKTRSRPSASAARRTRPDPGTTIAGTTARRPRSDRGRRAQVLEPAVRARPDEDAIDSNRFERDAGLEPHVRERTGQAVAPDRIPHRRGVGHGAGDGPAVLRARAPRDDRRNLGGVDRDLPVEPRIRVGRERPPFRERASPVVAPRRERPAFEVGVGRLVRCDHPCAGARLDRHVAEGHPSFDRERADRGARVLERVAGAAAGADAGDQVEGEILGGDAVTRAGRRPRPA